MRNDSAEFDNELDGAESALPWQDFVVSIWRHRRMVLTILLIGISLATVRAWMEPPTFHAQAMLLVKDHRARVHVTPDKNAATQVDSTGEQINSVAALIKSPNLVREVLLDVQRERGIDPATQEPKETTGLLELPARTYRRLHNVPPPSNIEQRSMSIASQLQVSALPRASLISVGYDTGSPTWAAEFVNRLTAKVIAKYTNLYENEGAQEFFHAQRNVLAEKLAAAQAELAGFREDVGQDVLTMSNEQLRARINEVEGRLVETQTELVEIQTRVANPTAGITEVDLAAAGQVAALNNRIVGLEIQRSELISRYTPTSAAIRDVDRQIAEAQRLLAKEKRRNVELHRQRLDTSLATVKAREAKLSEQLGEYKSKLAQLEEIHPELLRLQNSVDTQHEAYLTYLRKEEQARFSKALDESQIVNITVAEAATVPHEPNTPNMIKFAVMGAGASLFLGILLSLVRDWIDPSIKSSLQAERLAGVPVLGEIHT